MENWRWSIKMSRLPSVRGAFFLALTAFLFLGLNLPEATAGGFKGVCNGDDVNVRDGHGEKYAGFKVLYRLNKGNEVEILDEDAGWFKIRFASAPVTVGEKDQWVLAKFIEKRAPVPVKHPEYFWAELGEKEVLIDVTQPVEGLDAEALLKKYPRVGEESVGNLSADPRYVRIPPEEVLVPAKFREGEEVSLLTSSGVVKKKIKTRGIGPGASENHFFLILEGMGTPGTGTALVWPVGEEAPDQKLRVPVEKKLSHAEKAKLLDGLREPLLKTIKEEAKGYLNRWKTAPEHCRVLEGTFPYENTLLVAVEQPIDEEMKTFSLLVLVKPDGTLVKILQEPDANNSCRIIAFVDLKQDGMDNILLESDYYEGGYVDLLRWNGKEPVTQILTGDGA